MERETEISTELKDELKFIEKETRFMSQTPPSRQGFTIFLWCVFAVVLIAELFAIKNGNLFSVLFLPVVAVFLLMTHFRHKKLFSMYTDASEIISYYKQKLPHKVDPHFESHGSPDGMIP